MYIKCYNATEASFCLTQVFDSAVYSTSENNIHTFQTWRHFPCYL